MAIQINNGGNVYFRREGGAMIASVLDVWERTANQQWMLIAKYEFKSPTEALESAQVDINPGTYTCRLHTYVFENLNGIYHFTLQTDSSVIVDVSGDINSTSAPDDDGLDVKGFELEVL